MVLSSIGRLNLLQKPNLFCRRIPWHQCTDADTAAESEVLFLSRYLYERPHDQSTWNANVSAFVNHILDAIVDLDGNPIDSFRRRALLTVLCRQILTPGDRQISQYRVPWRVRPYFLSPLFPWDKCLASGAFELHLMTAQLLLGPPWTNAVDTSLVSSTLGGALDRAGAGLPLGPGLNAAIVGGDVGLVRYILENIRGSFDINHEERWYLKSAVGTGQMDMVDLVLSPPGRQQHHRSGPLFELSIVEAIRRRHLGIAWSLLHLDTPHHRLYYLHEGIREACHTGDIEIVSHILETGPVADVEWTFDCCITPLEIACRAGHMHIVRLLIASGANPAGLANVDRVGRRQDYGTGEYPVCKPVPHQYWSIHDNRISNHLVASSGAMFGAAVCGHIEVAKLLMSAGLKPTQSDWELVAKGVVECNQTIFLQWMLENRVLGHSESGSETFDLLGEACIWGNLDTMKLLGSHGLLSNRPTWALDGTPRQQKSYLDTDRYGVEIRHRFESPILVAMSWSRLDIVGFLQEQKWPPIEDISSTSVGPLWKIGRFPMKAARIMNDSYRWGWASQPGSYVSMIIPS